MGRGQLKYRKRGGGGRGGDFPGARGSGRNAARNESSSGAPSAPVAAQRTRRGGGRHSTAHLPSNTEKWGRAFGEGAGSAATTAAGAGGGGVGVEETERLLDESEWAVGSSAWRLAPGEDGQELLTSLERGEGLMAATSGELLSLNLDVLASCLRGMPVHERLRLPLAYTAELEGQARHPRAQEQEPPIAGGETSSTPTELPPRSPERRLGGGGVGASEGTAGLTRVAAKVSGAKEACRSSTVVAAMAAEEEGDDGTTGRRRAETKGVGGGVGRGVEVQAGAAADGVGGGGRGVVTAAATDADDGVLDALLGLTGADSSVDGVDSSVHSAGVSVAGTGRDVVSGGIGVYSSVPTASTSIRNSGSSSRSKSMTAVHLPASGLPSPAPAQESRPVSKPLSKPRTEPVRGDEDPARVKGRRDCVGGVETGIGDAAGRGSGGGGGDVGVDVGAGVAGGADELEDWLDGMLADA